MSDNGNFMTGEPRNHKAHVVVVEDNPADVELLRWALEGANVECDLTIIDDGGDAMAFAHQKGKYADFRKPDLALIDLNLPKHDGWEILEAMRSNRAFAEVPVAVMSSSSRPSERVRMKDLKVERYVTKPADLEAFMRIGAIVKELLAERGKAG